MVEEFFSYFLSKYFFLDALFTVLLLGVVFYYVPYIFKSIFSGRIDARAGSYRFKDRPFIYLLLLAINFLFLLVSAVGALLILDIRVKFIG